MPAGTRCRINVDNRLIFGRDVDQLKFNVEDFNVELTTLVQLWVTVEVIPRKKLKKKRLSASTNVNEMERITRLEWGQEDQDMSQGKDNEEQPRWRRERIISVIK